MFDFKFYAVFFSLQIYGISFKLKTFCQSFNRFENVFLSIL